MTNIYLKYLTSKLGIWNIRMQQLVLLPLPFEKNLGLLLKAVIAMTGLLPARLEDLFWHLFEGDFLALSFFIMHIFSFFECELLQKVKATCGF